MAKSREYYYNKLNISSSEKYSFNNPKIFIKNSLDYVFDQHVVRGNLSDLENFENFIFKILPWYANVLVCDNSFGHFVNTPAFLAHYLDRKNYLYSKSLTVNTIAIKLDKLSTFGNPLAWRNVLIEKRMSINFSHDFEDNTILFPYIIEPAVNSDMFFVRMCAHEFPCHYRILNKTEAIELQNVGMIEHFAH